MHQAHVRLDVCRFSQLNINLDVLRQSNGEELCLLARQKMFGATHECQDAVLLVLGHLVEWKASQSAQTVVTDRWAEPLVAKLLEVMPRQSAGVTFEGEEPVVNGTGEVVGSQPNFACLQGTLALENLLA